MVWYIKLGRDLDEGDYLLRYRMLLCEEQVVGLLRENDRHVVVIANGFTNLPA